MKEIEIEQKTYKYLYEAADGTRFESREECQKYEKSAKGVIKARFKKLVVYKDTECNILGTGSDDFTLYGVRLSEEKDKDTILQLYLLDNPYAQRDENEGFLIRAKNLIDFAYKENDILLIGENYDGDFSVVDCCKHIVNRLYNTVGNDSGKSKV